MADLEGELSARSATPGSVYGVVPGDEAATTRVSAGRDARGAREHGGPGARVDEGASASACWHGDMIEPVQRMYAESMRLSERWAREFREFWDLPEDFEFDVPTPEVDLAKR